ncbi:MAG TPA: Fe-S cluster assembly protein SufD [Thermoanaerobaculia bacterium]|nr:Fe-S cluster assembly protein SufD [Thermoanaerobaculia bacterium]
MEALAVSNDLSRASLEDFREERSGTEPDWLKRLRREGMDRFRALGLPAPGDEAWKYTSVARIASAPFRSQEDLRLELASGQKGVRVARLKDVLASEPGLAESHLARHADFRKSAFTALNTAFLSDGAFVHVERGAAVAQPIMLNFLSRGEREAAVTHPRNLIVAEAGSQAAVVEAYSGDGDGVPYFTNAVTEVVLGEGAVLEHYKVQRESLAAFHVQTIQVSQGRASNYTSHNLCLGGALARTDWNVVFGAEGGECVLNGLFLAGGSQHLDNHTLIDHAVPHCASRELYKGILDGKARGVFHGKIIVRLNAQKTDAMQTNKNLLLSREALVNSTPALEILADDVKCRHGSTIGQLDANALFYLRSRGIGERQARALLTYGFAADVAGRIRIPAVREEIEKALGLALTGVAEKP